MSESQENLDKAESSNPKMAVGKKTVEAGQPLMVTMGNHIQSERRRELRVEARACTFNVMAEDADVSAAMDITNMLALSALYHGNFVAKTKKGKIAADFLNYNIRNLSHGTWMQAVGNMTTDIKHGFSTANIVYEKRTYGKYKGNYVLKKIAPRSQESLYAWVWDDNFRDVVGLLQKPMTTQKRSAGDFANRVTFTQATALVRKQNSYTYIPIENLLHTVYNPENNDPMGKSPFLAFYNAWKEKVLIAQYEVIGVTKDMGGALVIRVPSELIEKANDPENYPAEAKEYAQFQIDAGNLHAGKSAFIVLSSDADPDSKLRDYDIEFKGVDGGGKQYSTSAIIDQKRKAIYNAFGAGFLLLGQDGAGSLNLSTNQMTVHDQYANRSILWKVDAINTQLIPRLLAKNNIFLDWEDMPYFEAADPKTANIEAISKAIQRMKSTGALTEAALTDFYKQLKLPVEGINELVFNDGDTSRAGEDTGGTSGIGDTQSDGAGSDMNNDNAS